MRRLSKKRPKCGSHVRASHFIDRHIFAINHIFRALFAGWINQHKSLLPLAGIVAGILAHTVRR